MTAKSIDIIGGKGLRLVQDSRGVKASVDGLLLARFVRPEPGWRVADLGCGNGLVGLILASEQPECTVLGVDIQEALLTNAAESAAVNDLDNIRFLGADLRAYPWPDNLARFDLVAANPPYRKVGTGRISPDPGRAAARHEVVGSVHDFAASASAMLRDGGCSTWVFLAARYQDLIEALVNAGLEAVRSRYVRSRAGDEPSLVLVEAIKGGGVGSAWQEPPLTLYRGPTGRDYTDEARELLYGG
ncbi:MAG: methyltransferase domain-containing protein [bacterium]|nr:MAG: methyltransferase domain-containing protein [bacterium]